MSNNFIRIYNPNIDNYKQSAQDAIDSGWISNQGKYVNIATEKLNETIGSKYSILMANGTCSTHCLFLALKYKHPDINKIYVPNNCYVAPWNVALNEYNIDQLEVMKMDKNTWNICTDEEYINSLDTNSAILIVHNLGNIVNVGRLKRIRPDIIFIEDNCEGIFGMCEEYYSGITPYSLCSSCSFYGNKIVTTGEGGAFFTQDEDVYNYVKSAFSQGMSQIRYLHNLHAYNYRMTNIQAGFLYDQLKDIDNIISNKKLVFSKYDKMLSLLLKINKIKLMEKENNTVNAPWIYGVKILNNNKTVDETINFYAKFNVDVRPFFYPINAHHHLSKIINNDDVSYELNREIIMIPSSPTITNDEQCVVIDTIYKFLFYNQNMTMVNIDNHNKEKIYNTFLSKITNDNFIYFTKRDVSCFDNHKKTVVIHDNIDNKLIAYAHIDYDKKNWLGIYVVEEFRNLKIGSLLISYMIQNMNENIFLTVNKNNDKAKKLYEYFDFKTIDETEKYYMMELENGRN
jgi:perosamine synthetase